MAAIGVNSKSTIARLMRGLEERGYLKRMQRRARAFALVGGAA